MILGTISSVDNVNGLKVIVDGESTASTKKYNYLSSYVPTANDRVLIEEINGSYVIIGKVISEVAQSGIVRQADNATNATNASHATSADSATNANNATYATNATNAVNATNATNATTAASCSGNAATATTAASCSGNAATSTVSDRTKALDSAFSNTIYGQLVTRVDRIYNSTIGSYIVTDVATSYTQNFAYK